MVLLVVSFLLFMIMRMPISFCMLGSSVIYMLVHGIDIMLVVQRLFSGPNSFVMLAVPGFILAANLMNTGGITTRIFNFADKCVGHITGGLGHANIVASVIFAGMSGSALADAAGLGSIELKAMRDANYPDDFSIAITGASSVIGPIIPPSIPAVVYAVVASQSVGELFVSGIIPGLVMALSLSIYVYFYCKKIGMKPHAKPSFKEIFDAVKGGFFSLLTPIFIVGSIWTGIATPTEAAFIAVIYSIILGLSYKTIRIKDLPRYMKETLVSLLPLIFLVASSAVFAYVLAYEQIPQKVASLFLSITTNKVILIVIINLLLVVVGMFLESISAIIILTPILLPLAITIGMNPIQFGLIMIINLMTGMLTPPVGVVLYALSTVSGVKFERVSKSMLPYVGVLYILVLIFSFVPSFTLWLPSLMH